VDNALFPKTGATAWAVRLHGRDVPAEACPLPFYRPPAKS
jgi:hypothetical protein